MIVLGICLLGVNAFVFPAHELEGCVFVCVYHVVTPMHRMEIDESIYARSRTRV